MLPRERHEPETESGPAVNASPATARLQTGDVSGTEVLHIFCRNMTNGLSGVGVRGIGRLQAAT